MEQFHITFFGAKKNSFSTSLIAVILFSAKSGIVWHLAAYQLLVQDQETEDWFSETDVHVQILGM